MTGGLLAAQTALADLLALGGWVFALLLAMSVLARAAVLWKLWHLAALRVGAHSELCRALAAWQDGAQAEARARLAQAGTPLATLALRAIAADPGPDL